MATTTPNFGWPVPTSTDLVKDGATAMEALGDAIDTSMVDLKGGTTGQVLSKASGTDMDFSWTDANPGDITGVTAGTGISGGGTSGTVTVTNSMATAIDAKGDLIGGTGADTFSRLAVGTNGQVLTADSTAATGLAWATPSAGSSNVAGKNAVLNSNFSIWQRATSASFGSGGVVTSADRWATYSGNASTTLSRQVTGDTTNLPFIQYCGRMQRTAGNTGTNDLTMANSWETINSIPYAGKTVTFSFYARAGANYSATSNAFLAYLRTGTGTDQNYTLTGYTGSSGFSTTATLTTTWQRFSVTGTVASNVTEIATEFRWSPTGTAGANDYAEVTGVQVEIASSASAYSPNTSTYATELAACQRYYFRSSSTETYAIYAFGMAYNSTSADMVLYPPTAMRVTPTAVEYSSLALFGGGSAVMTVTSITNGGNKAPLEFFVNGSGGLSAGTMYRLLNNATTSGYLAFSAEL